jgi:peptide/nickel transport system substrate-binding protein
MTARACVALPLAALLLSATASSAGGRHTAVLGGGTLRVKLVSDVRLDFATTFDLDAWRIAYATCSNLMTYPDRSDKRGAEPRPDAAAAYPTISGNGKTFTFQIRGGLRFRDGARITAANYAAAIDRDLDPATQSPAGDYLADIVGARRVAEGKARHARGVMARGDRLVIDLLEPHPDLVFRLAMPFFCPIPVDLPHDPDAVDHLPGSGPYYVASHLPNEQIVLKRNRFYRGWRAHRPDEIVFTVGGDPEQNLHEVEQGLVDVTTTQPPDVELRRLARHYRPNHSRLYTVTGPSILVLALNASRPLFRENPSLRRAVNVAVDRAALARTVGFLQGATTDHFLPPVVGGYRATRLYPRRPDVRMARALARGHRRSATAVMYTRNTPPAVLRAQIVKRDLARIGIKVDVKVFAADVFLEKITRRGTPFDIADVGWYPDYPDPSDFVQTLVDGRSIRARNNDDLSYFDNVSYDRRLERAARLAGSARYRAFGQLDVQIMRQAAPYAPYAVGRGVYFVSRRVGCVVRQPYFVQDYAAFCLRK